MKMEFKTVDVDDLVPNPFQPRESFGKESISELADSLKSVGEIQPIIVRKHKKGYQIIAGERRWRAAKLARLKEVPVLIKDTVEEDVLLESLIENLHRANLEPHEEENAVNELWETGKKTGGWKTHAELGKVLGKSEGWVASHIEAKRIRDESLHARPTIATRTILDVGGVEKEDRETILAKVERGEIKTPEVREYARVVKKAPEPVKKAIFEKKITPVAAEAVIQLPKDRQSEVLREAKAERFTEAETIARVQEVKAEIERPLPSISEIKAFKELADEAENEIRDILRRPEVRERGRVFRNLLAHRAILSVAQDIYCPECGPKDGWEKLVWIGDGKKHRPISIKEAYEKINEEYKKSIKGR